MDPNIDLNNNHQVQIHLIGDQQKGFLVLQVEKTTIQVLQHSYTVQHSVNSRNESGIRGNINWFTV